MHELKTAGDDLVKKRNELREGFPSAFMPRSSEWINWLRSHHQRTCFKVVLSCRNHCFTFKTMRLQSSDRVTMVVFEQTHRCHFIGQRLKTNVCFNISVCLVFSLLPRPSLVFLIYWLLAPHPCFCMLCPDSIWAILAKENFSSFFPRSPGLQAPFEEPLVPRTIYTWHVWCSCHILPMTLWPCDLWLSNAGPTEEFTPVPLYFLSVFQWLYFPVGMCNYQVFSQATQTENAIVKQRKWNKILAFKTSINQYLHCRGTLEDK